MASIIVDSKHASHGHTSHTTEEWFTVCFSSPTLVLTPAAAVYLVSKGPNIEHNNLEVSSVYFEILILLYNFSKNPTTWLNIAI
jgi:hypothetical protein